MKQKQSVNGQGISGVDSSTLIKAYYLLFGISTILVLTTMIMTNGKTFDDIFYYHFSSKEYDHFMDFFNSMRDAHTRDVYKTGVIYPPLANLVFYFLASMLPDSLAATAFEDRCLLQTNRSCLMFYILYVVIVFMLCIKIMDAYIKKCGSPKNTLALPVFFMLSYPVIYCIERGNIALFVMALCMFFVFFRDSENKVLKELSFISLAFAAALKIYPAVFGLLLITDKKYKEAARLLLYGVVLFFLPFAFFHGFDGLRLFVQNVFQFSGKKTAKPSLVHMTAYTFVRYLPVSDGVRDIAGKVLFAATYLVALVLIFLLPENWKKLYLFSFFPLNNPATSRTYMLSFILIPMIVLLMQKEKHKKLDVVYFVLFCGMLITIPALLFLFRDSAATLILRFSGSGFEEKIEYFISRSNQVSAVFFVQGTLFLMAAECLYRIIKKDIKLSFKAIFKP